MKDLALEVLQTLPVAERGPLDPFVSGRVKAGSRPLKASLRLRLSALLALLGVVALASGCARVPVAKQRLVSKPNMLFADYGVFTYQTKLLSQTEPGTASSGGAQAAACSACK
ncbi:MAG: hypothetical protein HYY24_19330 [Verrucomicrobia bacterium]|nr:hypothetical protein [Verrucomicrobiota bacterium]